MKEKIMKDSCDKLENNQEWGCIKKLSPEEQERLEEEAREKAHRDYISRIRFAEKEGRREAKIETATKMLQHNEPIEDISKFTELSFEEISGIARKNNLEI